MSKIKANQCLYTLSKVKWFVAAAALSYVVAAQAQSTLTLESFLDIVAKNNAKVQGAQLQRKAAELKKHQGDYAELSPFLIVDAGYGTDNQQTTMPDQMGVQTKGKQYSLGLSKMFSTGTTVAAKWGQTFSDITGTANSQPLPIFDPRWESKYTISFSQSLWKNSLGRGTRLRHSREEAQEQVASLKATSDERMALIDAEDAYWNLVVQTLDVQEKSAALKRVQGTRDWTAKRLNNGIADRADLLQIESLLTVKKLDQLSSQNKLEAARKAFNDALGNTEGKTYAPSTDLLNAARPLAAKGAKPQRIDIWIQKYAAKISESAAREAADMTNPDLVVMGSLGANARDTSIGTSANNAVGSDNNFYNVGVKLSMSLDFGLASDIKSAASAEAKAARLIADKVTSDTNTSWEEFVRAYRELSSTITLMESLSKTQDAKLAREQERLHIGRTTTAQVTTFEQEVADFNLKLLQTKAELRKLEAKARLFLTQSEVEAL